MNPIVRAYYGLRYLGPRFVGRRLTLEVRSRLGFTRRTFAARPWSTIELGDILQPPCPTELTEYVAYKKENAPPFLFAFGGPPAMPASIAPTEFQRQPPLRQRLRLLGEDRCVYFLHKPSPEPIDWYHNPFEDTRGNAYDVWCDVPDFTPEQGDPRVLWEPSRAAWAFDLARARARGLDFPSAEQFWRWLDSWMTACPPFGGFQWKCGQEAAVRFIAIAFAFWTFAKDPQTSPQRWLQFARLAWATGYRISRHIEYAISQNNNHALSEACGLLIISHLFPEFREAEQWPGMGRRVFEEGIRRQVYADGSYIQHSMNYHRVMLHVAALSLRLAELVNQPFDGDVYERVGRAGELLFQMTDPVSGRAPNYGNNDGACVLPLTECGADDFRPVVQSIYFLVHRKRLLGPGPWDEEMHWLFGDEAVGAALRPAPWSSAGFSTGGYYKLKSGPSWAMVRCHRYRDRPGQCDPMHVDLLWEGMNILRDCGTYLYYSPRDPQLGRHFMLRRAHNTVRVDGAETAKWVTRFLFVPYPRARCTRFVADDEQAIFEGEEYDYERRPWRVLHRRALVAVCESVWLVVDDFLGSGVHSLELRWHLADYPFEVAEGGVVTLSCPQGLVVVHVCTGSGSPPTVSVDRGNRDAESVSGVAAPFYSSWAPIPAIKAEIRCPLPHRLVTVVGLGQCVKASCVSRRADAEEWEITCGDLVTIVRLCTSGSRAAPIYMGSRLVSGVATHVTVERGIS